MLSIDLYEAGGRETSMLRLSLTLNQTGTKYMYPGTSEYGALIRLGSNLMVYQHVISRFCRPANDATLTRGLSCKPAIDILTSIAREAPRLHFVWLSPSQAHTDGSAR